MNKETIIILLISALLVLPNVTAITALDAVKYVNEENDFLLSGETVEQPVSPITVEKEDFWAVPVIYNETISTYFVLETDAKKISESEIKNRQAVSISHFLRELIGLRQRFSESLSNEWIVSSNVSRFFSSVTQVIDNEFFEMNLIDTEMDSTEITAKISLVKQKLSLLSSKSTLISNAITETIQMENDFIIQPSDEKMNALLESLKEIFAEIDELNSIIPQYSAKVNELKQVISLSGHENAAAMIKYANSPDEFTSLNKYINDADTMKQNIDSIQLSISGKVDTFLEIMDSRIQRNELLKLINNEDSEIEKKLGEKSSITKLINTILDEKNKGKWKKFTEAEQAEANWIKANRYLEEEKFTLAKEYYLKARDKAIEAFQGGQNAPPKETQLTEELVIQMVIVLIVLLAVIYVFNNRQKFFPKEEEEE
ncbi:MAG: hypothetical protein ABIA76_02885 [Candidatus Diapherotrites archaeon]